MSCCEFEPVIRYSCIKEIIRLTRSSDLNAKAQALQHGACFIGCGAKMLETPPDDSVPPLEKKSLLDRILNGGLFGTHNSEFDSLGLGGDLALVETEELLIALEDILPEEEGGNSETMYGALPWAKILTVIIPIILELLKR